MNLTPELAEQFDKLGMQLRGYEVARENDDGSWEVVMKLRPNQLGLEEAIKAARWLEWRSNQRKLGFVYKARPIVSIDVGLTEMRASGEDMDLGTALVQDVGDIIPFQPFDHEAAKGDAVEKATDETQPIATTTDLEKRIAMAAAYRPADLAAGGFVVASDKPAVPFNYADQAAAMPFDLGGES